MIFAANTARNVFRLHADGFLGLRAVFLYSDFFDNLNIVRTLCKFKKTKL